MRAQLEADMFVLPVLLGGYSDRPGTFTTHDFQDLLFENNPTGTLTDYYDEVSYGRFRLTGTVFGWFTTPQPQAFYASDNNGRNSNFPRNVSGFVVDIVTRADPTVDFSQFDNDGPDGIPNSGDDDGYADAVMIVCSGAGPDWAPSNDNLWPTMARLRDNQYTTNDPSASGDMVKINTFVVCPERAGSGTGLSEPRPIGVFAHEFGHILGLPDLYDRTGEADPPDFERSRGLGHWCLMAWGAWGGDDVHPESPVHMSSWCKVQLGWLTPTVLTEDVTGLAVGEAETNPEAYWIWEDGCQWSRYFLMENRQRTGFDRYLSGVGLLIFHVDENRRWGRIGYNTGPVNDDETHKLVDLEEADGRADLDNNANRGDAGDPFPGRTWNRRFTNTSAPNSKDYDGAETGVEITNISDPGPVMTVDVVVREAFGYVLAYDENGITGSAWGFGEPRETWGGVHFTTTEAGVLEAVDLGFRGEPPYSYELRIYQSFRNPSPTELVPSGELARVFGEAPASGWYTVPITELPVVLEAEHDFFVGLKIVDKRFALSLDGWGERSGRSWASGSANRLVNSISTSSGGGDLNIRARIRFLPSQQFRRGDCNDDGEVDISDAVFLLMFNFLGGEAPPCHAACDANADGDIDGTADPIYTLTHRFVGGPPPLAPFPQCGPEALPSETALDCATPPVNCP